MTLPRLAPWFTGLLLTLALSTPAGAQGKSQQSHGNNGHASKPSESVLPAAPSIGGGASPGTAAAAPFAWVDNASLMPPGYVWLGLSTTRWQGSGLSETNAPVLDAAVGVTPRVQFGASAPRVAPSADATGAGGSLGTTFFSAKVAAFRDDRRSVNVAVAPTLEILGRATMEASPDGRSRVQFGVPVSVDIERSVAHLYASLGYFSPGVWFMGTGAARTIGRRTGVAISFSRAWSSPPSPVDPAPAGPRRNDLTGSVSVDLTSHVGVFGSLGQTIATAAEDGAGTTMSVGLSLTAGPMTFVK